MSVAASQTLCEVKSIFGTWSSHVASAIPIINLFVLDVAEILLIIINSYRNMGSSVSVDTYTYVCILLLRYS